MLDQLIRVALGLAASLVLLNSSESCAASCWVKFTLRGASTTHEPDGKVTYAVRDFSTESLGNVGPVMSDPVSPSGFKATFNLPGIGAYKFEYEGNVSKLRIRQGGKITYEGNPISSYSSMRGGPLQIELVLEGDVLVKVADECS